MSVQVLWPDEDFNYFNHLQLLRREYRFLSKRNFLNRSQNLFDLVLEFLENRNELLFDRSI